MKYSFNHPASLIKDVEIFSAGKNLEALLYAPEKDETDRLPKIKRRMEENGFQVLADTENGRDVL
jgi:uncharacterized lipoprotein